MSARSTFTRPESRISLARESYGVVMQSRPRRFSQIRMTSQTCGSSSTTSTLLGWTETDTYSTPDYDRPKDAHAATVVVSGPRGRALNRQGNPPKAPAGTRRGPRHQGPDGVARTERRRQSPCGRLAISVSRSRMGRCCVQRFSQAPHCEHALAFSCVRPQCHLSLPRSPASSVPRSFWL